MNSEASPDLAGIPKDPSAQSFPIVGVGASAGGLGAITQLLRHLGDTPGVAVVIVQHLDPTHASNLVELLGRTTSMPIATVTDGEVVRVGHVYVLPPGAELSIDHGALRLTPRVERSGPHLPIDLFFDSLASDCGARAVAVVLSGTGADGSRGVQSIKAEGGISFAQEAAEHPGMPDSAAATGCVDFVLPVEDIALELARMGAPRADDASDDGDSFRQILSAIRRVAGVDFAHYKPATLRRRMQRRATLRRVGSLREYAALVVSEPAEVEALSEEVLIHVTSFFRDPQVFESLKRDVFPRLLAGPRTEDAIRVWVPGCSSGEEVYSIAMCLAEFLAAAGAPQVAVKMFGTDVSRRAIERARAGVYHESIADDVAPERLARYFLKTERGYEILKEVRDRCVFATHDIARDPPFSKMDLISCRNLMIYFGTALQQRILPMFHYALNQHGFLVLGASETIGAFAGFSAADAKNKIFAREPGPGGLGFDYGNVRGWPSPPNPVARAAQHSNVGDVRKDADRAIVAAIAPVGVVVTEELTIVEFRGDIAPYLEPTPGVATLDLLRMARDDLRVRLRRTIDEARATGHRAKSQGVTLGAGESEKWSRVDIDVIPFRVAPAGSRFFAVLFTQRDAPGAENHLPPPDATQIDVADALRDELGSTREYLQSVIAQLEAGNEEGKAANEEIISFNEELQSTNEELQTAKEELQATNEELRTVNDEMLDRNVESTRLADDLSNVLSSVAIPIVILGRESQIRRFTPTATKILKLIATDIGRPITDIQTKIGIDDLPALIVDVLQHLVPVERTVQADDGRWYQLEIRPYRTLDNRIDGTVLSVYDIDARKRAELLLAEARDYAESIVDTMRECLVVLDRDLRVCSANRAFCEYFDTTPGMIAGHRFDAIGAYRWRVPILTHLLESLARGEHGDDIRLECHVEKLGRRTMLVNGRRMTKTGQVLLTLADITDRARTEDRLARSEVGFRHMLSSAAGAIVMSDAAGRIVFANEMAKSAFGYEADAMLGLSIEDLLPGVLREAHAGLRHGFLAAPTPRPMGRDRELTAVRKDGREFPIEVALSPMEGSEGQLVVAFVADVTARREAERRIADYQVKLQRTVSESAMAEERERRQIARDLHDRVGQSLALARIKLEGARGSATGDVLGAMTAAIDLIATSIADTRTLTFELAPPVLYDLGLKAALSWLAEDIEKRSGLHIDLSDDGSAVSFDDATAALLFRAVRELLTNVFKHGHTGTASVALAQVGREFQIRVEDKGAGFDAEKVARGPTKGFGLFSVREQIVRLGGAVDIDSAPTRGTIVSLKLPIPNERAAEGPDENPAGR